MVDVISGYKHEENTRAYVLTVAEMNYHGVLGFLVGGGIYSCLIASLIIFFSLTWNYIGVSILCLVSFGAFVE